MLVKSHLREYSESMGVLSYDRSYITFMDEGQVKASKALLSSLSPIVSVNFLWLAKQAWVTCKVASTDREKRTGLQSYRSLEPKQGLYFGYPGGADVTFHQGSVSFPLDIMFLREDEVVKIERDTRVGYDDHWSCKNCDGVVEVNAGFCEDNEVETGDIVAYFANSEIDVQAYKQSAGTTMQEMAYDLCNEDTYYR